MCVDTIRSSYQRIVWCMVTLVICSFPIASLNAQTEPSIESQINDVRYSVPTSEFERTGIVDIDEDNQPSTSESLENIANSVTEAGSEIIDEIDYQITASPTDIDDQNRPGIIEQIENIPESFPRNFDILADEIENQVRSIFSSQPKEQSEPINPLGYESFEQLVGTFEEIIQLIWKGFEEDVRTLFTYVVTFTVIIMALSYIFSRQIRMDQYLYFLVSTTLVSRFLTDWDFVESWFYHPLMELMGYLPTRAVEVVGKVDNPYEGFKAVFMSIDEKASQVIKIAQGLVEQGVWYDGSLVMMYIYSIVLQATYFTLQIASTYVFIIAFWYLHIMLMALPFVLPFAVLEQTRHYFKNTLKHIITALLMPLIATLTLTVVILYIDRALSSELAKAEDIERYIDLDAQTFFSMIVVGAIGILFTIKSSSFAAMIVGVTDTGFGQAYGAAISAGAFGVNSTLGAAGAGIDFVGGAAKGARALDVGPHATRAERVGNRLAKSVIKR